MGWLVVQNYIIILGYSMTTSMTTSMTSQLVYLHILGYSMTLLKLQSQV